MQIVAFALSLMVLLLLTVVRTDILEEWRATVARDAPNYFLINIDPEQWPDITEVFQDEWVERRSRLPAVHSRQDRAHQR